MADQGDAKAQSSLGLMYDMGQGVPKDFVLAEINPEISLLEPRKQGRLPKLMLRSRSFLGSADGLTAPDRPVV